MLLSGFGNILPVATKNTTKFEINIIFHVFVHFCIN